MGLAIKDKEKAVKAYAAVEEETKALKANVTKLEN